MVRHLQNIIYETECQKIGDMNNKTNNQESINNSSQHKLTEIKGNETCTYFDNFS